MDKKQFYSNPNFDRAASFRELNHDNGIISTNSALLIPMFNEKFLFGKEGNNFFVQTYNWRELAGFSDKIYFLGKKNDQNIYSIDLSAVDYSGRLKSLDEGEFISIRKIIPYLDRDTSALLAYAKGLSKWNKQQVFCGVCGTKTIIHQKGHSRKCNSSLCSHTFFPQISPAIIVLIEHKPKNGEPVCLLNKIKFKNAMACSTFAGFVEIGESLEDAVAREMKEEVDVDICSTQYIASQPWPFSSALMVGFIAETKTKAFKVDGVEIKDAAWYSAKQIQKLNAANQLILSREDSIARYLIQSWVNKQLN